RLPRKRGRNGVLCPEAVQRYRERAKTPLICGDIFKESAVGALSSYSPMSIIIRRKWSGAFIDSLKKRGKSRFL
ncbi:MAG: hypothetical protein IJH47_10095, partial [Oscillospiraceae bacterium]|nr:hypothetical protein [Oscillospiraceae bacterium]